MDSKARFFAVSIRFLSQFLVALNLRRTFIVAIILNDLLFKNPDYNVLIITSIIYV
nr:MAG TPA: hypothetical protein [Caudoviricetes sp.]